MFFPGNRRRGLRAFVTPTGAAACAMVGLSDHSKPRERSGLACPPPSGEGGQAMPQQPKKQHPSTLNPGRILDPATGRTRSRAELAAQAHRLVQQLLAAHLTRTVCEAAGLTGEARRLADEAFEVQLGHVIDLVAEGIATGRVLF
jgi:hypothetical protein